MARNEARDAVYGPTPQRWTAKRKAAVCVELLKGKTTAAEIARKHALRVGEVEGWRERFLSGGEEFLKALPKELEARYEAEKKELFAKIGELSLQVEVFTGKRACGPSGAPT